MQHPRLRHALIAVALLVAFPLLVIVPTISSSAQLAAIFAWAPRADAPVDRVEGVGALVDGRLYVLSGFTDAELRITRQVDVYDLAADSWTAAVSELPGLGVTHITPAVDGASIWIAGGFVGDHPGPVTAEVWRYDTAANQWSPGPPLPEPRAAGGLVRLGRRLHYFGGFAFRDTRDRLDNTSAAHWTLDLDDPAAAWRPAAPLPEPLGHLSGIALGGQIYAIGGQIRHDRSPEDRAGVYAYDPARDIWEARASLPTPRSHAEPGTFELRGRIVVVGGRNNTTISGSQEMRQVALYDPASDLWLDLPQLPYTRIAPIAVPFGSQIVVTNGGLFWNRPQRLSLGGLLDGSWEAEHPPAPLATGAAEGAIVGRRLLVVGAAITETLAFDLSLGEWEPAAAHPPRPLPSGGQAVEGLGGRLYVFGGEEAAARALQIYDPAARVWSAGAELPFAANGATATRIGELIYLVGAEGAARYRPAADAWEPIAAAPAAASGAAAGSDGASLYLFGGRGAGGPLDVVQRYSPATGQWASSRDAGAGLAPLPEPRADAGRALYAGGEFYLFGGSAAAAVYTPATGRWRAGPAVPSPRLAPALGLIADRVYMAGGAAPDGLSAAGIAVYNIVPPAAPSPTATPSSAPTATPRALTPTHTPTAGPTPGLTPTMRAYLPLVQR